MGTGRHEMGDFDSEQIFGELFSEDTLPIGELGFGLWSACVEDLVGWLVRPN